MTFSRSWPAVRASPRRNLAAPTPPASAVIGPGLGCSGNRPRAIGSLSSVELLVGCAALHGKAAGGASLLLDDVDRDKLARVATGLSSDAFLHQRAGKIVASGLQRDRGEVDAE